MVNNTAQQITLALLPKFTSILSFLASSLIIRDVLHNPEKRSKVYHRTMLALSIVTALNMIPLFFTTWPMPKDTQGVVWAIGNDASCTSQGFFIQAFSTAFGYYGFLSLYFCLILRYHWSDRHLLKVEKWAHALIITFGLLTAIIGAVLQLYNPAGMWCWIYPAPGASDRWVEIYQVAFFYVPLWCCFAFGGTCMVLTYKEVREIEVRAMRHNTAMSREALSRTKAVANRAYWYLGTFLFAYAPPTINRALQWCGNESPFVLPFLHSMTITCLGMTNFAVYARPHYVRLRSDFPNECCLRTLGRLVVEKSGIQIFYQVDNENNLGANLLQED